VSGSKLTHRLPRIGKSTTGTRSIGVFLASAIGVPLLVLAIAACGGGGGGSSTGNKPAARPKTADGQPATIGVANSGLGKILVDAQGRTLYLFKKDRGSKSA
jgi:predicted lipoprotein with Yx(FWY)xxD motif